MENCKLVEIIKTSTEITDEVSLNIGGLLVEQNYVLPFLSAISKILNSKELIQTTNFELLENEKQKLFLKNRIKKVIILFGLFLFITLCLLIMVLVGVSLSL